MCMQPESWGGGLTPDEDCLYLNIYVPGKYKMFAKTPLKICVDLKKKKCFGFSIGIKSVRSTTQNSHGLDSWWRIFVNISYY